MDIIHTEEGIAQNNDGTYSYNLSDHLGNVRYTFDIYKGAVRMLQQDNYYAVGLRKVFRQFQWTTSTSYNGKELQDELGQYDYGARFYDPVIGRLDVVDPLAEDYGDVSPYNYVLNDPISNIDPDGTWVDNRPTGFASTTVDGTGKIIEHKNDGDNSVYQFVNGKKTRIGFEKLGVNYSELIGQQLTNSLFWVNNQLSDVEVKGLKKSYSRCLHGNPHNSSNDWA